MSKYSEVFSLTKGLSVLFVEDFEEIRESTMEILEHYFKTVDTACDGEEGLAKYYDFYIRTGSYYDLIITDIEMPVINGVSLVKEIKSEHEDQQIIVLSAHDESHYLFDLINLGVAQYIKKPIEIKLLLDSFYKVGKRLKEPVAQKPKDVNLGNGYIYDNTNKSLSYNNKYIKLTKHESIILEVLVDNIEHICTTEQIISHFSSKEVDITADNIRFLVSKLRKKLPQDCIDTLYAVGYRLSLVKQFVEA
jgi:DNA-binding response OmpR family regulator